MALWLFRLTVATAAACAYHGRDYFLDSWSMWKLRSSDPETRMEAARDLVERKCLRAVPEIVRLVVEDPWERVMVIVYELDYGPNSRGKPEGRLAHREASPLVLALWNMGEEALPEIERSARDSMADARIRETVEELRDRRTPMISWAGPQF